MSLDPAHKPPIHARRAACRPLFKRSVRSSYVLIPSVHKIRYRYKFSSKYSTLALALNGSWHHAEGPLVKRAQIPAAGENMSIMARREVPDSTEHRTPVVHFIGKSGNCTT
jgi:hypothetical protein